MCKRAVQAKAVVAASCRLLLLAIRHGGDFLKNSIIGVSLGIASGIVAGVLLGKHIAVPNMKKWCKGMESRQTDTEIRLGILEYNHLHEDDYLRIVM